MSNVNTSKTHVPVGQKQHVPVGQASRLSEASHQENLPSFTSWQRHLPHFQLSSGYYFITFTTIKGQKISSKQKDTVFNALKYLDNKKFELYAAVILNNHVHILINPFDRLSKIMHSIKSYTSHKINKMDNRKGKYWQNENYDRVIRDEREFLKTIEYIANNPLKEKLAKEYEDYKWLYVQGWLDNTGEWVDRRDACPTVGCGTGTPVRGW